MTQSSTVVGYFSSRSKAESAINALKDAGFTRNEIGLAIRSAGSYGTTATDSERAGAGEHHEAGMWERIKEFFGGEPAEPYVGERSGNRFDDREISPESYGDDDLHQSLSGLAVTDEQAHYFRHRFGRGSEGAIVTVSAAGRETEAQQILEENGGDVGASASSYDYAEMETPTAAGSRRESYGETARTSELDGERSADEQNIRLYGEVLRVYTDRVNRGEARLRKEVHTTTQTVEVPVTREELVVERVPVTGEPVAESASFDEKEIRIPLSEERARVEKQPVVREEVRVGKKAVSDVETFNEQVRSEDLKVDENVSDTRKRKTA